MFCYFTVWAHECIYLCKVVRIRLLFDHIYMYNYILLYHELILVISSKELYQNIFILCYNIFKINISILDRII